MIIKFPKKRTAQEKGNADYLRALMKALGKYDDKKIWELMRDKK